MTITHSLAYADFFARIPSVLVFVTVMSFWDEYLKQRRGGL